MRSKLRHPIRAIREPFGTAGLIVACVALIAALGGSAIAAKGALTGKQKKEVEKIAKKFAGKPGAPGAAGPAGLPGAKGDTGAAGANGTNGKDGTNGTNGTNGKSVVVEGESAGGNCAAGGVSVSVQGSSTKQYVCNGKNGTSGGGSGGELAGGALIRGFWQASNSHGTSFMAPYFDWEGEYPGGEAPEIVYVNDGKDHSVECPGSSDVPDATEGFLCVYKYEEFGTNNFSVVGEKSTPFGASLWFKAPGTAPDFSENSTGGTWALKVPN